MEGHTQMKVKGWKNIVGANGNQKKTGVAILISDKTDFWSSPLWLRKLRTQCSLHQGEGSIPGLTQWVKDLVLLPAAV